MGKHAYLLIVHEYTYVLETLLKCINDKRNDVFLHIDKKTKDFPLESCRKILTESTLINVQNVRVFWGGYSQIQSEMALLKAAVHHQKYQYYHLLSGSDLPLKSQDEIHDFFDKNQGKEFIRFESEKFKHPDRVRYYYISQRLNSKRKNNSNGMTEKLIRVSCAIQRLLRLQRNKNVRFQKGTNWFSITDDFARYVVSNEKWIESVFRHTFCTDEIFLQTLLYNSCFKDNLYYNDFDNDPKAIMRYIDWKRGNPYTFEKNDYQLLIDSNMLFARKFSEKIDREIIDMIYQYVSY